MVSRSSSVRNNTKPLRFCFPFFTYSLDEFLASDESEGFGWLDQYFAFFATPFLYLRKQGSAHSSKFHKQIFWERLVVDEEDHLVCSSRQEPKKVWPNDAVDSYSLIEK